MPVRLRLQKLKISGVTLKCHVIAALSVSAGRLKSLLIHGCMPVAYVGATALAVSLYISKLAR